MTVQDEVPKSRVTLTYKTEVDGQPAVVDLPLRLMVTGDFSSGSSKDRQLDLDERALRSLDGKNTNDLMKDMGITLNVVVPNRVSPSEESLRVNLSIDSLESFSPDKVAKQIPQIRSLLLFKKLLQEMQSNVANKKELAQLLNKLYSDPNALEKMKEKLKGFSSYQIPQEDAKSPKKLTMEERN